MKIIAVANMKGGVGKTTTSIVLGDTLSAVGGKRVIGLDLDSQANFSWALLSPARFNAHAPSSTMTRWLQGIRRGDDPSLSDALESVGLQPDRTLLPTLWGGHTGENAIFDIAVANTEMRFEELWFEGPIDADPSVQLAERLRTSLQQLARNYTHCIMDCSPSMSALTRAGLRIADAILIPTPLNNLCRTSAQNFRRVALREMLGATASVFVVATRVGRSSGASEQDQVRVGLKSDEAAGHWTRLDPEFKETVEYMRALDPPEMDRHRTLRTRYGTRRADLKLLMQSLIQKGIA